MEVCGCDLPNGDFFVRVQQVVDFRRTQNIQVFPEEREGGVVEAAKLFLGLAEVLLQLAGAGDMLRVLAHKAG